MKSQRQVVSKIWGLRPSSERRALVALLWFMLIGIVLQTWASA